MDSHDLLDELFNLVVLFEHVLLHVFGLWWFHDYFFSDRLG
jgi:hypothetical protein